MNLDPMNASRRTMLALGGAALAGSAATAMAETPQVRTADAPWTSEGSVARAGGKIHYVSIGEGEPLILLPKLGGWVADWRGVAPILARTRRVIAIDPPGHGDSTMMGPPPYLQTPPESAAMIMAALDELGIDRFSIAGNSLGGCIAIAIAAMWPASVRRLALVSVAIGDRQSRAALAKDDAAVRDQFGPNWEPLPRTPEQLARFGSLDPHIGEEQNLSRAKAGVWVRPSERGVGRMGVVDYLPRIAAPVLLVFGDRGTYLKYEAVGREHISNVTVEKVADAGSFVHQEKPAETARILQTFLDA